MPLINLKTDLKTLKYGGDRLGGGWSGEPYIVSPIDDKTTSIDLKKQYSLIRNSSDFPIRGGAVTYDPGTTTFTLFSAIDKDRIKRFMDDKPRGQIFIQKQIGLQLSNPNVQTGNTIFDLSSMDFSSFNPTLTKAAIPSIVQNTKIYNRGKNTLTQVGLSGTGLHAVRQGLIAIDPNAKYYAAVVGNEMLLSNEEVQGTNRLLILSNIKLSAGSSFSTAQSSNINKINQLGISRDKNVLFDYLTGPGSVYGIGKTTIRRYEDTREAATAFKSGRSMTYDMIAAQNLNRTVDGTRTKRIQDFATVSTEGAVELKTRGDLYSYTLGAKGLEDDINKVLPKLFKSNTDPFVEPSVGAYKDIIKFGFECISNNDPSDSVFLQFRAYLNGGITDNHSAKWNSVNYIGRGEDFFTYQGFTRTISFSFRVAAQSRGELLPIYNKLNYLVSQIYPDYSPTKQIMRGSIVKLTIGDYIYRMPGILDSVNLSLDGTTPWEINYDNDLAQLPQYIDVSISFRPILNELPKRIVGESNDAASTTPGIIANGVNGKSKQQLVNGENLIPSTEPTSVTDPETRRARRDELLVGGIPKHLDNLEQIKLRRGVQRVISTDAVNAVKRKVQNVNGEDITIRSMFDQQTGT